MSITISKRHCSHCEPECEIPRVCALRAVSCDGNHCGNYLPSTDIQPHLVKIHEFISFPLFWFVEIKCSSVVARITEHRVLHTLIVLSGACATEHVQCHLTTKGLWFPHFSPCQLYRVDVISPCLCGFHSTVKSKIKSTVTLHKSSCNLQITSGLTHSVLFWWNGSTVY